MTELRIPRKQILLEQLRKSLSQRTKLQAYLDNSLAKDLNVIDLDRAKRRDRCRSMSSTTNHTSRLRYIFNTKYLQDPVIVKGDWTPISYRFTAEVRACLRGS